MYVTLHKHLFFCTYLFLMVVCVVGWVCQSHRAFGRCYHAADRERYTDGFSSWLFFSLLYVIMIVTNFQPSFSKKWEEKYGKKENEVSLHSVVSMSNILWVWQIWLFLAVQCELHKLKVQTRVFYMRSSGLPGSPCTETRTRRSPIYSTTSLS